MKCSNEKDKKIQRIIDNADLLVDNHLVSNVLGEVNEMLRLFEEAWATKTESEKVKIIKLLFDDDTNQKNTQECSKKNLKGDLEENEKQNGC